MTDPFAPLTFKRGPDMKNRFMLAPLTNSQSHEDGIMSEEEYHWLTRRAEGGYGLVMTCASHVQAVGKGFPGQMGCFGDQHIAGLTRMASRIRELGAVSSLQLHHAGMRSPEPQIGTTPVCPSDNEETGARGLTLDETRQLIDDFIAAAVRAEKAGFDGAEIHGAHGYIVCQYLSPEINLREDEYGGSLENRSRLLFEIIDGIRSQCGADFQLSVRLSPERFGMHLAEITQVAQRLFDEGNIDFLDMSLWDVFKEPVEEDFQGRSLMSYFTELNRGDTRLGVAGKIMKPADVRAVLDAGVDFAIQGRAAILQHNFPKLMQADPDFTPVTIPVSREHLRNEGLSEPFINYMNNWPGFVAEDETQEA